MSSSTGVQGLYIALAVVLSIAFVAIPAAFCYRKFTSMRNSHDLDRSLLQGSELSQVPHLAKHDVWSQQPILENSSPTTPTSTSTGTSDISTLTIPKTVAKSKSKRWWRKEESGSVHDAEMGIQSDSPVTIGLPKALTLAAHATSPIVGRLPPAYSRS